MQQTRTFYHLWFLNELNSKKITFLGIFQNAYYGLRKMKGFLKEIQNFQILVHRQQNVTQE